MHLCGGVCPSLICPSSVRAEIPTVIVHLFESGPVECVNSEIVRSCGNQREVQSGASAGPAQAAALPTAAPSGQLWRGSAAAPATAVGGVPGRSVHWRLLSGRDNGRGSMSLRQCCVKRGVVRLGSFCESLRRQKCNARSFVTPWEPEVQPQLPQSLFPTPLVAGLRMVHQVRVALLSRQCVMLQWCLCLCAKVITALVFVVTSSSYYHYHCINQYKNNDNNQLLCW